MKKHRNKLILEYLSRVSIRSTCVRTIRRQQYLWSPSLSKASLAQIRISIQIPTQHPYLPLPYILNKLPTYFQQPRSEIYGNTVTIYLSTCKATNWNDHFLGPIICTLEIVFAEYFASVCRRKSGNPRLFAETRLFAYGTRISKYKITQILFSFSLNCLLDRGFLLLKAYI